MKYKRILADSRYTLSLLPASTIGKYIRQMFQCIQSAVPANGYVMYHIFSKIAT